jgi:glycerol dehydrogenase-like iron-containing ADH family enzyme
VKNAEQIREVTPSGIETIMKAFEGISIICRRFGSSRPQEASDHTFAYNAEFQTRRSFYHGELVALGSWVMANLQENEPEFLEEVYQRCGILWQPADLGLTKEEFIKILSTLNWYQSNFGRRYSILNKVQITEEFIQKMVSRLSF